MEKLLELNNVSAGYDNNIVLSEVNMQVYDRDFIGVIGISLDIFRRSTE